MLHNVVAIWKSLTVIVSDDIYHSKMANPSTYLDWSNVVSIHMNITPHPQFSIYIFFLYFSTILNSELLFPIERELPLRHHFSLRTANGQTPVYSVTEAWIINVCVAAQTNGARARQKGRSQMLQESAQRAISSESSPSATRPSLSWLCN